MTVTGDPVRLADDQHPGTPATASPRPVPIRSRDVCPYLVAGDGSWQSAHAAPRAPLWRPSSPPARSTLDEAAPAVPRRRTPRPARRTSPPRQRATTTGHARRGRATASRPCGPRPARRSLVLEPERRLSAALERSRTRAGGQAALDRADGRRLRRCWSSRARRRRSTPRRRMPARPPRDSRSRRRRRTATPSPAASPTRVRRPVRDHPGRRRSRRPDPTASATR